MKRDPSSVDELLAESADWRLLSLLLSRPTAARRGEVERLYGEVRRAGLRDAAVAWLERADEGAYLRLFGPGGLVPARSVAYSPFADPGWMLADILRHHAAFGYRPVLEEPVDHVAAVADFVGYLWLKEAYAREQGDGASADVARQARGHIVEEYLAPMAAALAVNLDARGATGWSAAAHLVAERIPAPRRPAVVAETGDGLSCGLCGEG